MRLYRLNDRELVQVDTLTDWALSFDFCNRKIASDRFADIGEVSTVFIGIDTRNPPLPPLCFETLVRVDGVERMHLRVSTYDQAERLHAALVSVLRITTEAAMPSPERVVDAEEQGGEDRPPRPDAGPADLENHADHSL